MTSARFRPSFVMSGSLHAMPVKRTKQHKKKENEGKTLIITIDRPAAKKTTLLTIITMTGNKEGEKSNLTMPASVINQLGT